MKAFIVPMLAAALLAPAAHAQQPPIAGPVPLSQHDGASLSLANAIGRARQNNSELRILAQEVAALEARAQQAGARLNPTIEYLREGKQDQAGASTLQVAVPLELGGKRSARVDAAMAELQVAVADLAVARMRVQAEVVGAFHEAYLAELRLALANSTSESARLSTHSAASRVVAGKISPVEETRSKVAEANLQVEAVQARRDLAEARIKLAFLCGSAPDALPKLAAPDLPLPVPPSERALAERLAAAPVAQRATADLAWRNAAARLERSRRYPDLSVIVGQKREGIGRDRQTVLGLSVPLPLFDRNQGAILESQRRVDKSRAEQEAGQMRLRADAAQAASRLDAALEQERLIREHVLPAGESAFSAAGKGFNAGKFSFLEVLDAQRTYFHAQAQHLRAVSEAHRAAADLAALMGPDTASSTIYQQDTQ
jgi:cobalt-zinc-cadmium efflux system outer membrane protein